MSDLYCEHYGEGPALVLVHGWGLHGGIWGPLAGLLAQSHHVIVPDLPGHGRSPAGNDELTLDSLSDQLAALTTAPALWLGWSLGGLAVLNLAVRHPSRVSGLVLAGSTPKFVQAPDWPHAMPAETFAQFGRSLNEDYRATLQRFLSLQAGTDEHSRAAIKRLRADLFAHGQPQPAALTAGLAILEHADLRARLGEIAAPALVLHGSHDRLAMPAAGDYLAAHLPRARLQRLSGAGHAPFLSQPAAFVEALQRWTA